MENKVSMWMHGRLQKAQEASLLTPTCLLVHQFSHILKSEQSRVKIHGTMQINLCFYFINHK